MLVESCENQRARLLPDIDHIRLRPRETASGPTMMLLADISIYASILTTMGAIVLAVTTNLNIKFLRKWGPYRDLLENLWLMKIGKILIVSEFTSYSQDEPDTMANSTSTYSIPPKPMQTKVQS